MLTRRAIPAVALVVSCLTAAPAFAQGSAVRRPYRGLFGAPVSPDSPHSLVLSGSLFAAYDDNVIAGIAARQTSTPWLGRKGTYQGANVALSYGFAKPGDRVDFRGQLRGGLNYYHRGQASRVLPSNQGTVSLSGRLTRTLRFAARQSVSYASAYSPSLTPRPGDDVDQDIGIPDDDALDLFELQALRTASTVSLSQSLGRSASMTGSYHFRSLYVLDEDEAVNSRFHDYATHGGSFGIGYARPITRHAALQLGYNLRASDRRSGTGEPRIMHNVDAGVNYSRALSFSRRTSFSFGTGSAIAVNDRLNVPNADPATRVRLTGSATLVHEIGRSWTAQLAYSRGYRTRDGFEGLYFTDAVRAGVGGLVTRRLSFNAAANWADSSIERYGGARHRGYSANAQAQYALNGFVALYARYIYYHYRFSDDIVLDERFPRQLDRHGVRVGLTASVPLLR